MANYPRLSGGIFIKIHIKAQKKYVTANDHTKAITNTICESDILLALIHIADASWNPVDIEGFKKYTSYYKNFHEKGSYSFSYLPFDENEDENIVNSFKKLMANNYDIALNNTEVLISDYLDTNKLYSLANSLLLLISKDNTIDKYFVYKNIQIKKDEFLNLGNPNKNELEIAPFILSIWYYIVCHIQNNLVGKSTFENWCNVIFQNEQHGRKKFICPYWTDNIKEIKLKLYGIEKYDNYNPKILYAKYEKESQPETAETQEETVTELIDNIEDNKTYEQYKQDNNNGIISYGNNATNIVNNGFMTLNIGVKNNDKSE